MKLFRDVLLIYLVLVQAVAASFDNKKGARPLALGGAFTGMANNGDAYYYNPAGLWQLNNPNGQFFYSAPFNLKDLNTIDFNFTNPFSFGNGTVNFESYGFDLYRETTFGLAYSNAISDRLAYGVSVNYYHLQIQSAGTGQTFGLDAGLLFKPHEIVSIGFFGRNINRPKLAHEELPQVFSLGASVRVLEPLAVNVDLYKDVKFPADVRVGAEYQFFEKLFLRLGVSSKPSRFSAGLGFDFGYGSFDYALYTHPDLGVTHALSATIHLNRKPLREMRTKN